MWDTNGGILLAPCDPHHHTKGQESLLFWARFPQAYLSLPFCSFYKISTFNHHLLVLEVKKKFFLVPKAKRRRKTLWGDVSEQSSYVYSSLSSVFRRTMGNCGELWGAEREADETGVESAECWQARYIHFDIYISENATVKLTNSYNV